MIRNGPCPLTCGKTIINYDHFHTCLKTTALRTTRHNIVVNALNRIAVTAGLHPTREPQIIHRELAANEQHNRGDLIWCQPKGETIIIDVMVTCTTAPSNIDIGANYLQHAAQEKITKHGPSVEKMGEGQLHKWINDERRI